MNKSADGFYKHFLTWENVFNEFYCKLKDVQLLFQQLFHVFVTNGFSIMLTEHFHKCLPCNANIVGWM